MHRHIFTLQLGTCALVLVALLLVIAPLTSAQEVRLEYWHHYGGEFGRVLDDLVAEFNAAHPDITIESQYAGTAWTARDKLFVALAGGGGPDVGLIDQFWASQLAEAGFIHKMQDFFPADFDQGDVLDVLWETASYNDEIWSMPSAASNIVLYYNKDLFREAGLDPDAPPTNWDELMEIGMQLSRDTTGDGNQDQWGLDMPLTAQFGNVYFYIAFLWQAGGELFTADNRAAAFNSEEGLAALQYWLDLLENDVITTTPPSQGWQAGAFGMQLASSARLDTIYKPTLNFDFGIAPMPAGEHQVTGLGGNNLAIFTDDSAKQAAAWTFVEWMSSTDVNLRWAMRTGYAPLRHSVLDSPEFQGYLADEPRAQVGVDQMAIARPRPNIPAYADASRVLGEAVENALFGGLDPVEVLAAAEVEVNQILREYE